MSAAPMPIVSSVPSAIYASPEAAFAAAQEAVARRDWASFVDCLDPADLRRLAAGAVAAYARELGRDEPWLLAHCAAHDFPTVALAEAERRGGVAGAPDGTVSPFATLAERRRRAMEAEEEALRDAVQCVRALPDFVAPLLARVQAAGRRGAISTTVFLGESLEGMVVEAGTACATRTVRGASLGVVKFARRAGGWRVRLP